MRHRFACSLFMEKEEYEIVTYEAMANLSACLVMFGNGCIAQPQRMQLWSVGGWCLLPPQNPNCSIFIVPAWLIAVTCLTNGAEAEWAASAWASRQVSQMISFIGVFLVVALLPFL